MSVLGIDNTHNDNNNKNNGNNNNRLSFMIDNNNNDNYNDNDGVWDKVNVFDIHDGNTIKINKLLNYHIIHYRNDSAKKIW